ncbi:MAG TPA: diguanylate cyclase [Gaiellaceae bacterium]|nr:diguanylate cyclase [Gaiellaceae bacterium]
MNNTARSSLEPRAQRVRGLGTPAADDEQATALESYRRLAAVFHDVLSEQSLDSLLDLIADTLEELVPYEALHIYEVDATRRELVPQLVRSDWAEEVLGETIPFGAGITGWAVERLEPVLANRAHLDPRVAFVPGTPDEPEALIVVPLVARGALKGTLNVYRIGEDVAFTEQEFELAQRFGDAAALALDNAHVRARLEHQAQTDSLTGLLNHRSFHERLARALAQATREQESVCVVMVDLDDFKQVNDVYGHAVGDDVLVELARHLSAYVRPVDAACRVGGEEFAVIVPSVDEREALAFAERLAAGLGSVEVAIAGHVCVSVGVAVGPTHAANPRELVACAEAAMMTAKARGKNQVVLFEDGTAERPADAELRRVELRSIAHLKMLQSVGAKLNRLDDVREIGATIARELHGLIEYHNCRIFLRDGDRLFPIAFAGLLTHGTRWALDVLESRVGEGFTGHVVASGRPLLLGDAGRFELSVPIEGTDDVVESVIAAPLNHGTQTIGAIVVSKLGRDQFDRDDLRLLEVLAGHAAVALENARLYEARGREAETARALLAFGRELSTAETLDEVLRRSVGGAARVLASTGASVWLQDSPGGELVLRATEGEAAPGDVDALPAETLAELGEAQEPVVVRGGSAGAFAPLTKAGPCAVVPVVFGGRTALLAVAAAHGRRFDDHDLELLTGLAHGARLALANVWSHASLEQTFLTRIESLATALEDPGADATPDEVAAALRGLLQTTANERAPA